MTRNEQINLSSRKFLHVRSFVALLFFCLLVPSIPAEAQPLTNAPITDATRDARAKQFYEAGVNAANQNQWEAARMAFLEAWKIKQHYQIAVNLGQAELNLGRNRDAAEHLAYFMREATAVGKVDRKHAGEMLAQARANLGVLQATGGPKGMDVLVDGTVVGRLPFLHEVFLEPGRRHLEGRLAGYSPIQETLQVEAGTVVKVDFRGVRGLEINKGLAVGGAAASLALAAAGVSFAIISNNKSIDAIGKPTSDCTGTGNSDDCEHNRLLNDRDRFANASFYSFIASGVIGAGTFAYVFLLPKRLSSVKSGFAVRVGIAGIVVNSRW